MLFRNSSHQIIILGYNNISFQLSKILSKNYDVIILYYNSRVSDYRKQKSDVITKKITDNLVTIFKEYQSKDNFIFISLTENEELNLFSARLARRIFAQKIMALVYSEKYKQLDFNIDLIFNPYQILWKKILSCFQLGNILQIKEIISDKINLISILVNHKDSLKGKHVQDLIFDKLRLIAVKREDNFFVPPPDFELQRGDKILVLSPRINYNLLKQLTKLNSKNKLFLIGGNKLSLFLHKKLKKYFKSLVVVEPEIKKCNWWASNVEKTLILQGKRTDLELYINENINQTSHIIALSNNNAQNLLASYGVNSLKSGPVITVIYDESFKKIAKLLKLEKIICFPLLISRYLVSFINLKTKYINKKVLPTNLTIKRLKIRDDNWQQGVRLTKYENYNHSSILAVKRKNKYVFPQRKMSLHKSDEILLIKSKKGSFDEY